MNKLRLGDIFNILRCIVIALLVHQHYTIAPLAFHLKFLLVVLLVKLIVKTICMEYDVIPYIDRLQAWHNELFYTGRWGLMMAVSFTTIGVGLFELITLGMEIAYVIGKIYSLF